MTDIAIRVENLGKRYPSTPLRTRRISALQARHDTLRDLVASFQRSNDEWIWAWPHVSFEVKRGEVVGAIGRDGAGTLAPHCALQALQQQSR